MVTLDMVLEKEKYTQWDLELIYFKFYNKHSNYSNMILRHKYEIQQQSNV